MMSKMLQEQYLDMDVMKMELLVLLTIFDGEFEFDNCLIGL